MVKGTWIETRVVSLHSHEAYQHILNFIETLQEGKNDLQIKVVDKGPSHIKAKIMYGLLEISISPRDGESIIDFNFNFDEWLRRMYIVTVFGSFWYILLGILLDFRILALALFHLSFISWAKERTRTIENKFMERLDSFLSGGVRAKPKIKVEGKPRLELPPETLHLYQRLIDRYSRIYGRSISALEYRIEEYMWEGLSREEAIRRLAEEENMLDADK